MPPRDQTEHLKEFDFIRFQGLLGEHLKAIVRYLEQEKLSDIYVFGVSIDADTSSVSVHWNTPEGFEKVKEMYRSRWPDKYRSDGAFEGFQYSPEEFFYSDGKIHSDHANELYEILADFDESLLQAYEDHGSDYSTAIHNRYSFLLFDSAIRALESVSEDFEALDTTKEFVYFVQPYDLPPEIQVIAAERTVPKERVKEIYPLWFKKRE